MAINQQITSAPTAPQRSDPNTFADRADAFVAWLENLDDELNQWASECNSTEENINDSEQTVLQAKSDTLAARDQAVAEANAKVYDNSETYSYPDCVIGSDGHVYRCMGDNITGEDPVTSTSGNWKRLSVALNSDKQLELPFAQTPILVNDQDMMSRTFHVDAENGDDNNDGSSSAPFASLSKAINSIPTGGWGYITLKSDLTISNTENPGVNKDNIIVVLIGDTSVYNRNPKITFQDNVARYLFGHCNKLWIRYVDVDFNLSGMTNSISLFMWNTHIYNNDASFNMPSGFGISDSTININVDFDYNVILIDSISNVRIDSNVTINYTNSTGNDYFKLTQATTCKNLYIGCTMNINGSENTDWTGHITNIVKDANGVPRNILCNRVL